MPLIQIRNVPDETHRVLKSRAALEGRTLSDYLREVLNDITSRPTQEEIWERIRARPTVELSESTAESIRKEREERDRRWDDHWS